MRVSVIVVRSNNLATNAIIVLQRPVKQFIYKENPYHYSLSTIIRGGRITLNDWQQNFLVAKGIV